MSLDLTEFLPCRATAEPVRPTTSATSPPASPARAASFTHLGPPVRSRVDFPHPSKPPGAAVSFAHDEDLGRLHRRRSPARPAADHRAPARARPRGRGHRARVRADRGHPRAPRARRTRWSAARRRATAGRRGARAPQPRRSPLGARPRLRPGARPRLGRPRRVARCCGSRRSRCRTTSTPGSSASSRSAPRAGCWSPTRSRSRRCARAGAAQRKLFRYPGLKEDYYLADFEPDPAVARELGIDPASGCSSSSARRPRPPPTTRDNPLYEGGARPSRGRPGALAVVIPRTEGQAEAARARAEPADRPRAGDRRPEPDRLRRPRGQRRRHDEPRGGGARDARLHDLQRGQGRSTAN